MEIKKRVGSGKGDGGEGGEEGEGEEEGGGGGMRRWRGGREK